MNNLNRLCSALILAVLMTSCDAPPTPHGKLNPIELRAASYEQDIKPVFESRCIACHSCYDAPCQLKLTSYEGVIRGGSETPVYEPTRLKEAPLTRLYFDADSIEEWRQKGFYNVLKEDYSQLDDSHSTLLGMLDLKAAANGTDKNTMPPIGSPETWQCNINRDEFEEFAHDYPNRGMPYGLPKLSADQRTVINDWIAQGANDDTNHQLSDTEISTIEKWEGFLNGNSLKAQLVARYIYEHLFLANLYFQELGKERRFFQLIRSRTPPGQSIEVIATRRPFDDPGVDRPYYRLRLVKESIVAKTHMPYLLDDKKFSQWQKWFFEREFEVNELPSYDINSASNPFKTFEVMPVKSRYQFMLTEANFTVRGFIKGPVCKGQSAVNVISEHFWVFFVNPEVQSGDDMMRYLSQTKGILDLPAEAEDTLNLFGAWDDYAEQEREFLRQRKDYVESQLKQQGSLSERLIWDGDNANPNAALTVFRHFDHASVRKGLLGQVPKTVWVIDYPLLERIHYLLVAGYDVYGNISHQLLSRIYMDFLRMEGESLFLAFMDKKDRAELRRYWYRDADERIEKFMSLMDIPLESSSIVSNSDDPKEALIDIFTRRIGSALDDQYMLSKTEPKVIYNSIQNLHEVRGAGLGLLPDTTLIELVDREEYRYFTLIKHVGHTNNSSILFEDNNIVEVETRVSVVPGFVAPRPNSFLSLPINDFGELADSIATLKSDEDYQRMLDRFGVKKTDSTFWEYYDRFNKGYKKFDAVTAGWLDLNSYEHIQ